MTVAFRPVVRNWPDLAVEGSPARGENPEQQLLDCVTRELERTGYLPLRQVDLRCDADSITLFGQVPSYFLKQLAQATAQGVPGVAGVNNQLRVISDVSEVPERHLSARH